MRSTTVWMGLIGICLLTATGLQALVPGTLTISTTPVAPESPAVMSNGSGHVVVLWEEQTDFVNQVPGRILARRYDAQLRPVGQVFRINSMGGHAGPAIAAMDAKGGLAVTWIQNIDGALRLLLRLFDPSGTPLGAQIEVSPVEVVDGWDVARTGAGDICVTWVDRETSIVTSVLTRTFDPRGVPLSDPVKLGVGGSGTPIEDHIRPTVAAGADGRFFVAWERHRRLESVVVGQLVGRDASLVGERATISGRDRFLSERPSVSPGPDGGFLVSWMHEVSESEPLEGVFVRRYDSAGRALGDFVEIGRGPYARHHAVAADGRGGFLAVWPCMSSSEDRRIYGQHLDSAGLVIGGELLVVAPDPADHYGLDLAAVGGGDLLVAFTRDDQVLGRRLAVDLSGGTFHMTRSPFELEALGIAEDGFTAGLTSTVSVWRTGGSSGVVNLGFRTSDGSAGAGEDYVPLAGTKVGQSIIWRRFDASGTPMGERVIVAEAGFSPRAAFLMSSPRIVRLRIGNDAVMWLRNFTKFAGPDMTYSIVLRTIDSQGELGDEETVIDTVYQVMGGYALAAEATSVM